MSTIEERSIAGFSVRCDSFVISVAPLSRPRKCYRRMVVSSPYPVDVVHEMIQSAVPDVSRRRSRLLPLLDLGEFGMNMMALDSRTRQSSSTPVPCSPNPTSLASTWIIADLTFVENKQEADVKAPRPDATATKSHRRHATVMPLARSARSTARP